jgi:A49-like RNA polymerase I associated factor
VIRANATYHAADVQNDACAGGKLARFIQSDINSKVGCWWFVQDGCLPALLGLFYSRSADNAAGATYTQSATQRQLLTMYVLAVALIADGFSLGPREFEGLRVELNTNVEQLASLFRSALGSKTALFILLPSSSLMLRESTTVSLRLFSTKPPF